MKKIYRTLIVVLLSAGAFSVKAQDTKKEMDDKYVENEPGQYAGAVHPGGYQLPECTPEEH